MPEEENVAEENVTEEDVSEESEEEAASPLEEDEVVAASSDVESESDSGSSVDADEADEEEEEAPTTFANRQDAVQATFVRGAQALDERKKAERAERLATEQPPRGKPQFVR